MRRFLAGGGDVRSGDRRAGGRYARSAGSPRQLHRRADHHAGSTGRASTSAARAATARPTKISPARTATMHSTSSCSTTTSSSRLQVAAVESRSRQAIDALVGFGALCRLQLAMGRRRHRPRGELHARHVRRIVTRDQGARQRLTHLPDSVFHRRCTSHSIAVVRLSISDMATLPRARCLRLGLLPALRVRRRCARQCRHRAPSTVDDAVASRIPGSDSAAGDLNATDAMHRSPDLRLYVPALGVDVNAGRRPVHARGVGICPLHVAASTPTSTPCAPASATNSDPPPIRRRSGRR